MKAYVVTTGTLFAALVVAHVWRVVEEGPGPAKDPFFIVITIAAAGLSVWAWGVLRRMRTS
jgi:hypothetical protein